MKAVAQYTKFNSIGNDILLTLEKISQPIDGISYAEMEANVSLRKKVEKLKTENDLLKLKLEKKERYKKTVTQAIHDIRTPLSVLLMSLKICENLPEREHIMLKKSIDGIKKIADYLLDETKNEEKKQENQCIYVLQALQDIVEQKKIQYNNKSIDFQCLFDHASQSAFIYGSHLSFERMMSNIIDNSVEAFDNKNGTIKIKLFANDDSIKIAIEDSGKGISKKMVDKLMRGETVSTTKVSGHGIGTQQIRDALAEFGGIQFIESSINIGTKLTLIIPKADVSE